MSSILDKLYETRNITNYKIHTDKCTFISTITENSMSNSFYLHLGGTSKGCVIIYIDDYKMTDTAILETIKYDSKCNITEDLEEGTGTKHMIFTALNILMYYFPRLKYVKLHDSSFKNCYRGDKNGATPSMVLATYFMLFHKKTWYDSLFGAKPIKPEYKINYTEFLERMDSIPITLPFLRFINTYFRDRDLKYVVDLNNRYNLQLDKLYSSSKTYSELFHTVKEKIGDKEEVCIFFGIFLFRFMNDISNETTSKILGDFWIFPTENIIKVHFREEPIDEPIDEPLELTGGYHFTELL